MATYTYTSKSGKRVVIGRAPKGGIVYNDRFYRGGQFCPAAAVEPKLPVIRGGSTAQCEWAEKVRTKKIAEVEAFLAEQAAKNNIKNFEAVDRAMAWLKAQDSYKFWLDDLKFYNGLDTFRIAAKATA